MKNYSINVLGRKIKIEFKEIDEKYCGLYYDDIGLIEVNSNLSKEKSDITICHELIHSVFFRSGLDQTAIGHDLQEIICDQVSKVICENYTLKRKIK